MQRKHPLPQPGDTFQRLMILEEVPVPERWLGKHQAHYHFYRCQCQCGQETILSDNAWNNRNTRSCGCLQREKARLLGSSKATHGEGNERSKEYRAWRHMKSRCLNVNDKKYHRYGGRGILVCPQWLDSYQTFLADVGRAPTPAHSIGRLDNNGPYEPGNVAWQTTAEQVRNTGFNRYITYRGETLTIGDWARRLGIKRTTLQMRLDKRGWSLERTMTTPVYAKRHNTGHDYDPF